MRFLRQQRVPFDVHVYEHLEKGAEFAAVALGLPLERFAKTLVVEAGGDPVFALMPGDRELSLKKLARAAGAKQAQLADPRDAERVTGYLVGGISPFGAGARCPRSWRSRCSSTSGWPSTPASAASSSSSPAPTWPACSKQWRPTSPRGRVMAVRRSRWAQSSICTH